MRFKKTFEVEYEADDEHWMNVWNLELCLRHYAPGGMPYVVTEIQKDPAAAGGTPL